MHENLSTHQPMEIPALVWHLAEMMFGVDWGQWALCIRLFCSTNYALNNCI